jgi:hypothetical protein
MSQTKQASRRKQRRRKAIPVLGAAGLSLSLVNGAWAAIGGLAADMPARNTGVSHEITLGEEEISGVSLATFYVFDKENPRTFRRGVQLAMGGRCGCRSCGGCGSCWTGTFNDSPGPPHSSKSAHKYTHATKPAPARKNRRRNITTQQR